MIVDEFQRLLGLMLHTKFSSVIWKADFDDFCPLRITNVNNAHPSLHIAH